MQAHKLEVFLIDFDELGATKVREAIENVRYPNHYIALSVKSCETREIGPWDDAHPLNQTATHNAEVARLFAAPPAKPGPDLFKRACWIHLHFLISPYLLSNAEGSWDKEQKATCHLELCQFYVGVVRGVKPAEVRLNFEDDFKAIHSKTQELVDHLDERIGFPLIGRAEYDVITPLFFEIFHGLAMSALD